MIVVHDDPEIELELSRPLLTWCAWLHRLGPRLDFSQRHFALLVGEAIVAGIYDDGDDLWQDVTVSLPVWVMNEAKAEGWWVNTEESAT